MSASSLVAINLGKWPGSRLLQIFFISLSPPGYSSMCLKGFIQVVGMAVSSWIWN